MKNIIPTEIEIFLLNLADFVFRRSIDDDQSEHLSNQFFCTQEAKHDVCNEKVDLKK